MIKRGYGVFVIDQNTDVSLKTHDCFEGINIYRSQDVLNSQAIFHAIKSGHYLKSASIFKEMVKVKYNDRYGHLSLSETYFIKPVLKEVLNNNIVDVVIPVCYPFSLNYPVMQLKKKGQLPCKWMVYMQDPFATHHYYKGKKELPEILKLEEKVIGLSDAAVVTDFVYEEFQKSPISKYLQKISQLPFPKIIKPILTSVQDDVVFEEKYINCVFLGRFNEEIRNPAYMYRIFHELKNMDIRLHVLGDNDLPVTRQFKELLGKTLVLHGNRSKEAAINALLHGDILMNLGNTVPNQLPSKIMEYCSTGKPIVNFYKIENCPTLKYMNTYPLALNICEKEIAVTHAAGLVLDFCRENRGNCIEYKYIEEIYREFTVEAVCDKLNNVISGITGEVK